MKTDIGQVEKKLADIEEARRQHDQAQGQLKAITDRIKSEFGCRTPADAKKKIAALEAEAEALEAQAAVAMAEAEEIMG
jgi:hypothetical protein